MVNREITIIVTVAAIMISIPVTFSPVFQAQGREPPTQTHFCLGRCSGSPAGSNGATIVTTAGANMTTGANMTGSNTTGAAGNTSARGSSITTSHPAAYGSAKEFKEKIDAGILPVPSGPDVYVHHTGIKPSGANMTSTSNMTGAAGNTTGGTHGSSIPTTHRMGLPPGIHEPIPGEYLKKCVNC